MKSGAAALRCICLTGPTASGKTSLALEIADWCAAEIVSMDSAMVYRHMDIGTDKPDQAVRMRVPHHLIDIRDPEDTYSAGAFARDAATAIREINARDRLALIVGGTLLYLRALRDGLTDLPIRNESVRAVIELEAEARGWPAMHAELAKIDPVAAARIEPTDRQRIQRGLEVFRVSGESLSAIQSRGGRKGMSDIATVALVPADRQALKEAIAMRFDAMTAAGLVDEVASLRRRPDLSADTPSMRSVGYRQVWAYLAGQCDWAAARERAIVATRQLAKRQMTWLRSDSFSYRIDSADSGRVEVLKDVIRRQIDR